jgi:hypothetical protein
MTSAAPAGQPGFGDLEANILKFLSALARQVLISSIKGEVKKNTLPSTGRFLDLQPV